jgi:hypothetical protein
MVVVAVVVLSRRERRKKVRETEGKGGKVWENLGTHLGFLVIRERV